MSYWQNLMALAVLEATNLRQFATKEELDKLDEKQFNASLYTKDIYGQMTGLYFSERANELYFKCAPYYYYQDWHVGDFYSYEIGRAPVPIEKGIVRGHRSPIEVLLIEMNKKHPEYPKLVIDYLKGKTETLSFF